MSRRLACVVVDVRHHIDLLLFLVGLLLLVDSSSSCPTFRLLSLTMTLSRPPALTIPRVEVATISTEWRKLMSNSSTIAVDVDLALHVVKSFGFSYLSLCQDLQAISPSSAGPQVF